MISPLEAAGLIANKQRGQVRVRARGLSAYGPKRTRASPKGGVVFSRAGPKRYRKRCDASRGRYVAEDTLDDCPVFLVSDGRYGLNRFRVRASVLG